MTIPGWGIENCDFVQTYDREGQLMFRCFGDNNHCFVRGHLGDKCSCGKRVIKAEGIFDAVVQ